MAPEIYTLTEVQTVAQVHPFYNKDILYPPSSAAILKYRELAIDREKDFNFQQQPLLDKKKL